MEQINNHRSIPPLSIPQRILVTFLRAFFTLLYHQLAWTYDWVASVVSLGAWRHWIFSILPYLDDLKTLELGFGPGHLQLALHQKGISVYGLDESSQMGQIARRRFTRLGLFSNLVRGHAQILPFASESFHQVVMTFPAEFILNQQTLLEVYRVLVSGGKAVIVPLAWITGRKPLERAAAWLNRITGEAPEWNEIYLEPLQKLGFDICWEMIDYGTSKILIIQLIKPSNRFQD